MAVAAVVGATGLVFLVMAIVGSTEVQRQLGDETFVVGSAERLAARIRDDGGVPLLFQDLLGRDRDIYVQHVGGRRWTAFESHAPGRPRRCQLVYDTGSRRFRDPCGPATYPRDGTGLVRYPARVTADGRLVVDLRRPRPAP